MDEPAIRESAITEVRQPSQVSWGAILAGWVLAAGTAWLLYQLGAAVGLSIIDPAKDEAVMTRGFSYGAGFWIFLTWIASLFLGGLFAARLAGRSDNAVGMLHGMTVWGITAVVTILLGAAGIAGVAQGGASLIGGGVSLGEMAAGNSSSGANRSSPMSLGLEAEIKQNISQVLAGAGGNVSQANINQALNQLDSRALAAISARLLRGDTAGAKNMIALNTNLSRADVDKVVNGLSARMPQYKAEVEQAAQQATRYSAALLWVMFTSTFVGLGAAVLGGSMGAAAVARAYRRAL
ncbi:MAG TPA: hypothetical protein VK138_02145 [Acidiferrobacterales bacterium]|nr:hypothetical protein [Acidiferrobacterales bacterium]